MGEGRSLAETPTWSVATVTTVMVAVCFVVERSIHRLGKWLKKTKRKALLASLEKIREELMLLGLISLMLSQTARQISQICVPSSLFSSRFYICSEDDFSLDEIVGFSEHPESLNRTAMGVTGRLPETSSLQCGEGHEPFVSYEGLEQLHCFLFILGMTHVLYSCVTVVLAMIKIYSWRKWENKAYPLACENLQARMNKTMKRQSTFVFHHASHPWSKNKILIWMFDVLLAILLLMEVILLLQPVYSEDLCFIRQFKVSITKSDYMALRLGFIATHKLPLSYDFHKYMVRSMEDEFHESVGISWPLWGYAVLCVFINIHGLNIYFWLSFVPAILVMVVGTKLQHVVAQLALEVVEPAGPLVGSQLKPRDDLFWFGKPEFLLWLIQFISFQNAFEMATFIWSLWQLSALSCFMKNHILIFSRLISGILIQFWCSYSTLPLNVIITQMGSKFKKSLIAESVRTSLHRWCRRVKERSKRDLLHSNLGTTRSIGSLESIMDERDETTTVVSGTLSRSSSVATLEDQTLFSASLEDVATTSTEEPTLFNSSSRGPN